MNHVTKEYPMRDYDEHFKRDYQGRDVQAAYSEARKMVDTILTPPDQTSLEVRQDIARKTVRNFRDHINKGFLEYRKSVTEAGNFAYTEWTGQGSVLVDALGREFLDILGGFGLYSYGIRHPKIVAAVKDAVDIPVLPKLTPNTPDIAAIAEAAASAGVRSSTTRPPRVSVGHGKRLLRIPALMA